MQWHFSSNFCCFTGHESEWSGGHCNLKLQSKVRESTQMFYFTCLDVGCVFQFLFDHLSPKETTDRSYHASSCWSFFFSPFASLLHLTAFFHLSPLSPLYVSLISSHYISCTHYSSHTFPQLQCSPQVLVTVMQTTNRWFPKYFCPQAKSWLTSDQT